MPNYFKTVQDYWKKKYGVTADNIPQLPNDTPIPSLKIHTFFRQRSLNERTGLTKYLLEFDIATQAVVIVIALFLIGGYVVVPDVFRGMLQAVRHPSESSAAFILSGDSLKQSVLKKVYANTVQINADHVFSVPPSGVTLAIPGTPKRTVYGFFPYWMLDKESLISFNALTQIALFGLDVDGNGNIVTTMGDGQPNPGWQMWDDPKLNDVLSRARKNRVSVELTFKVFNNTDIENLVTSDDSQKKFIANAIYLVQSKALNGINLDFEYAGTPEQKFTDGFTRLVTNLRAELKRQLPNSSLTVDTYISGAAIRGLFDIERLADQTDSLIIMGYDIHTPTGDPGPVAPLDGQMSVLGYMQSYLEKVKPDKLILAVPYYGYDWQSTSKNPQADMLSYAEIVDFSKDKTIKWDENAQTPYIEYRQASQSHVLHFENVRSLSAKYDFINSKNLKGVGIWALGYDGLNTDLQNLLVEKFAK